MVELPFGTWPSPLTAAAVAGGSLRISDVCVDGDSIYWIEGRPAEQGRSVIVGWDGSRTHDVIGSPFTARTAVHEYGGGAMTVSEGNVYFSDGRDGRVYGVAADGGEPRAITAADSGLRFADFIVDSKRDRLVCVTEDHSGEAVTNTIAAISLATGTVETLVAGADFYSSPRLSPDAGRLAWISWDFPDMPWDSTTLSIAPIAQNGTLQTPQRIAGGEAESIVQPQWSDDGVLHCMADRSGWWNLYRVEQDRLVPAAVMSMECARPHWVFGLSTYAFLDSNRVAIAAADNGRWRLRVADLSNGTSYDVGVPFSELGNYLHRFGDGIIVDGGSPYESNGLYVVDVGTASVTTIRQTAPAILDHEWISPYESVDFATPDGAVGHAFLYRPRNPGVRGPDGERPPLLVRAHGGPTSAARTSLGLDVQYWTTRGFAVCDINYGGSTGYGRAYRERLRGTTGCVDVDDCVAAALHLSKSGDCDPDRLCITGGSAGGYVVLCALVFAPEVFAAGTSYYGVTDCEALAHNSHKFEARYYDSLIGPYATHSALYHNRSPLHFASRITTPLLVLQGTDDPVVPLSQADALVAELRDTGVPHAYITFAGEQHGFRQAANIVLALESELAFYAQVLGFTPADSLPDMVLTQAE